MAAADGKRVIRNAPYRIQFAVRKWTDGTLITGAATPDSEISIDSGTFTDCAGEATELATNSGVYYTDLSAAEMTGGQLHFKFSCATANAAVFEQELFLEPCADSGVAQGGSASGITLRAGASAVDSFYVGETIELVRGTGAGQWGTITAYNGTTKAATVDGAWWTAPDATTVYKVGDRGVAQSGAGIGQADVQKVYNIAVGAVAAYLLNTAKTGIVGASSSTSVVTSNLSGSGAGVYDNVFLVFVTGAMAGLGFRVTAFDTSTGNFTVYPAMPVAPTANDVFVLIGRAIT